MRGRASASARPDARVRHVEHLGWAVLLTAAVWVGREGVLTPGGIAALWPAAGVTVTWLLMTDSELGRRVAGAGICGVLVVVNLLTGLGLGDSVGSAVVNLGHAVTAVAVLAHAGWRTGRPPASSHDLGALVVASVVAGLVGGALTAAVAALSPNFTIAATVPLVVVRNSVSTFVVVAALLLAPRTLRSGGPASTGERVALAVVALSAGLLVGIVDTTVSFAVVGIAVLVALRCGPALTTEIASLLGLAVVVLTALGRGPFADLASAGARVIIAQGFVAVIVLVGLSLAITQAEALTALARSRLDEERLRVYVDAALVASADVSFAGERPSVTSVNDSMALLLGRHAEALHGADPTEWFEDDGGRELGAILAGVASGSETAWRKRLRLREEHGGAWVDTALSVVPLPTRASYGQIEVHLQVLDVTATTTVEQRLAVLATHDDLTGLPNRTLLGDRLSMAVRAAERDGDNVGVLFVDLDKFKAINDTFGHDAGDEILREFARRLRAGLRAHDTAARIGGDEFVAVCPRVQDEATLVDIAERLRQSLSRPVRVGDHDVPVSASIGSTTWSPGEEPRQVLRRADVALYRAKAAGRSRVTHLPAPH